MRFDEAVKELSPATVEALRVLESEGFQVFLDVRIEDCVKPDGHRRRTFSNRGRYAVGALLKNLGGRERVEFPAFTPEAVEQGTETPAEPVQLEPDPPSISAEMFTAGGDAGEAEVSESKIQKTPLAWSKPQVETSKKVKLKERRRR